MSESRSGNWVVRIRDEDGDDTREDVTRIVTEVLAKVGYRVLSVAPPGELNPEPLRIVKERPR